MLPDNLLLLFIIRYVTGDVITNWSMFDTLPDSIMGPLIGYYSQQNTIWILTPSIYSSDLFGYDLSNKQFTKHKYPYTSYQWQTNGFTDINDSIYFVNMNDGGIKSFSMSLGTYTAFNWYIPHTIAPPYNGSKYQNTPCITKSTIDNKYIFITGGQDNGDYKGKIELFIIYDLNTNSSIFGPNIPISRINHGCIVGSDGYLYLFGGQTYYTPNSNNDSLLKDGFKSTNSIIRINVNDVNNIHSKKWETLNAVLPSTNTGLSVVEIDGYIYVLGGAYDATYNSDTMNTTSYMQLSQPMLIIYEGVSLKQSLVLHSSIVVKDQVYVFGGSNYLPPKPINDWEISNKIP